MFEYLSAKLSSFIGGLLGGLSILSFLPPRNVKDAFIRGGVSVGFAVIFAQPILGQLGLQFRESDRYIYESAVAFVCGFVGFALMSSVAKFIIKNEGSDIFEIARTIKDKTKKKR